MGFYELSKAERIKLVNRIGEHLYSELKSEEFDKLLSYFSDEDTYIRKSAYLVLGRIYFANDGLQKQIIRTLEKLIRGKDFKIRQTTVNAAGEIGKVDFAVVRHFFDASLFDEHHSVRNAVVGSVKKMGEVNPKPVLSWAKQFLHHPDKEIRREICHGIELRGRKYPQDILPMLKELQFDKTARVRNTLVHVLGQIAYKKGCLETVVENLKTWENKELVNDALEEIIDVHERYKDFAFLTQDQAKSYIRKYV
jgi:HEAT repeat protein